MLTAVFLIHLAIGTQPLTDILLTSKTHFATYNACHAKIIASLPAVRATTAAIIRQQLGTLAPSVNVTITGACKVLGASV